MNSRKSSRKWLLNPLSCESNTNDWFLIYHTYGHHYKQNIMTGSESICGYAEMVGKSNGYANRTNSPQRLVLKTALPHVYRT